MFLEQKTQRVGCQRIRDGSRVRRKGQGRTTRLSAQSRTCICGCSGRSYWLLHPDHVGRWNNEDSVLRAQNRMVRGYEDDRGVPYPLVLSDDVVPGPTHATNGVAQGPAKQRHEDYQRDAYDECVEGCEERSAAGDVYEGDGEHDQHPCRQELEDRGGYVSLGRKELCDDRVAQEEQEEQTEPDLKPASPGRGSSVITYRCLETSLVKPSRMPAITTATMPIFRRSEYSTSHMSRTSKAKR